MLARLSAFVIWALVAATAVFWGLRLFVRPPAAPAFAVTVGEGEAARGDLARLLGATPVNSPVAAAAPAASSRFKLLGIVAPREARAGNEAGPHAADGVALIAVDGKMPKAYAVGAQVDGDLVLRSVSLRSASIAGQGAPAITLELPPPASPATGTLGGNFGSGPGVAPTSMPTPVPQIAPQVAPQVAPQGVAPGAPFVPAASPLAVQPGYPPPQVQRRDDNPQNQ